MSSIKVGTEGDAASDTGVAHRRDDEAQSARTPAPEPAGPESFGGRLQIAFESSEAELVHRAYKHVVAAGGPGVGPLLRSAGRLVGQHADYRVVAAVLLVDLWRSGKLDAVDLERFGDATATLVDSASSVPLLRDDSSAHRSADLSSFFASVSRDSRALLVRAAVRVAELESIIEAREQSAVSRALATETRELYVPVAGEMGLGELRRRLEDLSFQILEPEAYESLAASVEPLQAHDEECLRLLRVGVERLLARNGVRGTVSGRSKGLYSLHRKIQKTGLPPERIRDKLGMRVVVPSVPECYAVLGLLHSHFTPVPGTFDDYIALPKPSGYRSLHTCVHPLRDVSDKPVEFQIRTLQMHEEAEFGMAAHWRYKRDDASRDVEARQRRWLEARSEDSRQSDPTEFVNELRRRVFEDEIVVFVDRGQRIRIPNGTTVGDFGRYRGGGTDVAVRVNGELRPAEHVLVDGDTVTVFSSKFGERAPQNGSQAKTPGKA